MAEKECRGLLQAASDVLEPHWLPLAYPYYQTLFFPALDDTDIGQPERIDVCRWNGIQHPGESGTRRDIADGSCSRAGKAGLTAASPVRWLCPDYTTLSNHSVPVIGFSHRVYWRLVCCLSAELCGTRLHPNKTTGGELLGDIISSRPANGLRQASSVGLRLFSRHRCKLHEYNPRFSFVSHSGTYQN